MEKLCKNCQWWVDGYCEDFDDFEEWSSTKKNELSDDIKIIWQSDDDSGLDINIATGPDFGCVHFKAKESEIN